MLHPLLEEISAHAAESGLFMDFDGTVSEIVDDPSAARPLEGVVDVLEGLSDSFAVVAVVSGRRGDQLLAWLGPNVEIHALHGAEIVRDKRVLVSDLLRPYESAMDEAKEEAARRLNQLAIEGARFEDKGPMFALHFRTAPDREQAGELLGRLADELAARHGLVRIDARAVIELRPPVQISKAQVVEERARSAGLQGVVFIGDDAVDLPAFDALDRLAATGARTARVAVDSPEAPPALRQRADVVLASPRAVLELLRELSVRASLGPEPSAGR